MENATKALLIAAAVLIAVLIISLGIVVYRMASETIDSVNFSGQEITAFNDQFTQYQGQHRRGSEVNAMLNTVLASNMKSSSEGLTISTDSSKPSPKFIDVKKGETVILAKNATTLAPTSMANTSKLYTVQVSMNATTGFVDTITITEE